MPKITRKDGGGPLQEAALPMHTDGEGGAVDVLPLKPDFGALSAHDQHGNKVEFRRVSSFVVGVVGRVYASQCLRAAAAAAASTHTPHANKQTKNRSPCRSTA